MTAPLVHGDHVSCSRVGGGMRRESARLHQHAQSLEEALGELAVWKGPEADAARPAILASLRSLRATADVLDQAGAALQQFATDLAEGHELGRRAELRVASTGLLLHGTRVIEPWGPASAPESERRLGQVSEVQARVDLATVHVGRARGRLGREMTRLAHVLPEASSAATSYPAPSYTAPSYTAPSYTAPPKSAPPSSPALPRSAPPSSSAPPSGSGRTPTSPRLWR